MSLVNLDASQINLIKQHADEIQHNDFYNLYQEILYSPQEFTQFFLDCGVTAEELLSSSKFTTIPPLMFRDCNITSIRIPSGITSIDSYAFTHCEDLKELVISSDSQLSLLGSGCFSYCMSLSELSLPTVKTVCSVAFKGCTSLETVNLPHARIYADAFRGCNNLKTLVASKAENLDLIRKSSELSPDVKIIRV